MDVKCIKLIPKDKFIVIVIHVISMTSHTT